MGQPVPVPTKMPVQRGGLSGRMMLIIVILLVAIIAGGALLFAGQDRSGPLSQRLTYRLEALEDILKDGKKNASTDKLRKVTSEASILLAGDMATLETVIPPKKGKKPAAIIAAESSAPSIERLKSAKINGTYNTAYESELTAKLETTSALTREFYKESKSKKVREALNMLYEHLAGLQKDLAAN